MTEGALQNRKLAHGKSLPSSDLLKNTSFNPSLLFTVETLIFDFQKSG
jgi:hypothetical protein